LLQPFSCGGPKIGNLKYCTFTRYFYQYELQRSSSTEEQDIADALDEGVRTDAIIIDFLKAFILVPRDRLFTKIVATGVDLRVVAWVKEFLLGRSQRVRVDMAIAEEVGVTS